VSNISVPLFLFLFLCARSPSLPFDALGPLSVMSSPPPPPRCRPPFVYSQSEPPSIVVFTSAPKFSYSGITPHLVAFLDGTHDR
jgi:hypothetical protein